MNEAKVAGPNCLIVTRFIDSRPNAKVIQPGIRPKPGQCISDYLFCETSLLGFRKGFLQTSTWLAPRQAFLDVPFTKELPRNQDTDWLLRAIPALNLEVRFVWKPLVIFHNESNGGRITSKSDWQDTLKWATESGIFTQRSLVSFIAMVCIPAAIAQREPISVFWKQLAVAMRAGRFTPRSAWLFFACWFVFPLGRFGIRSRLQNWMNQLGSQRSETR
jgi:hypothetical protein